ncbi:hypothetical protein COHA_005882 [Chlorella ohadii]|uniref:Uncharacterized protein n=1 Tax=Chlorella ohadii TaxID=2649997 RepID=A0AAD5H5U5_9CHLO|nr:hypothetical protein COHA_005882 [Chlorella ohadii]
MPQQRCLAARAGQRRQRDPANYRSMDDLRAELERGEGGEGLVTGLIKWLGAAANTAGSAASPLQAAYRWLLSRGAMPGSRGSLDPDDDSDLDPQAMRELQALLLVGRPSVARMIRR